MIAFFVASLRKLRDWIQGKDKRSKYKEIPSPAAYPLLQHLPYLWRDTDLTDRLLQWAKMFHKEGIFRYDSLLGNNLISPSIKLTAFASFAIFHSTMRQAGTHIRGSLGWDTPQ